MTTVIGLKVEKGPKKTRGVVLGSDFMMASTVPEDKGEFIYKRQVTTPFGKLYVGKGDKFVIGVTGLIDDTSVSFLRDLLKGKFDLEKAITKKSFLEIREMNLLRWGKRFPGEMTEFLLAYRFDKDVGLYRVYPLGDVEETTGVAIGSGAEYALERIRTDLREKGRINTSLTARYIIDLINKGLKASDQDIYSQGFDLKIVRQDKVLSFGREIKKRTDATRAGLIKYVKQKATK